MRRNKYFSSPLFAESYSLLRQRFLLFTHLTYNSIAGDYDLYPDLIIGRCGVDDTTKRFKKKRLLNY
ncbi:MAG: hypothetical protein WBH71_06315 [Bacteroidales bacterium]|jgi:hypothetical protein|nr:hypothetical protein [Bacteroidales bacterium]MDI9592364.1 hypothetical protein [Bacteroidota bacterium]